MTKRLFYQPMAAGLTALLLLPIGKSAIAEETVADVSVSSSAITFQKHKMEPMTISVSGGGSTLSREFSAGEIPQIEPYDEDGNPLPDGQYSYSLSMENPMEEEMIAFQEAMDAGDTAEVERLANLLQSEAYTHSGSTQNGVFIVKDGRIEEMPDTPNGSAPMNENHDHSDGHTHDHSNGHTHDS